jgi:DNA-binding NarL/FixJ family response regulator
VLEQHVDSLATESAEDLLFALQEAVDEMQAQLAYQRETLAGMLSDRPQPAFATVAPLAPDTSAFELHEADRPAAAGEFVPRAGAGPTGVRGEIARLAEDGLSDRAIARELHIGLEEVRIARMLGRQS